MAYRNPDDRRAYQREWERTRRRRDKPSRAVYYAAWKAVRDPNLRRERDQEQRFRFTATEDTRRNLPQAFSLITRKTCFLPDFIVVYPSGRKIRERWESLEHLVGRFSRHP